MKLSASHTLLLVALNIILLFTSKYLNAQGYSPFEPLIEKMTEFEGNRDPKCAATANRLEDFIYGTPLLEEARIEKARLQKALIITVWEICNTLEIEKNSKSIKATTLNSELNKLLNFSEKQPFILTIENHQGKTFEITKRDLLHYSSVAYAYRAILSAQQDVYFEGQNLLPLESDAYDLMISFLDKSTLAVLQFADEVARKLNENEISAQTFTFAWNHVFNERVIKVLNEIKVKNKNTLPEQLTLVNSIVESKQKAFEKYNNISMFVFQRNAQVYFSRHAWPKDKAEKEKFLIYYNETLIQFVKDLWKEAEAYAYKNGNSLIRLEDISAANESYLPYKANQLEDITFFPELEQIKQVDVEAYDLDAFRDGGVHWTYVQMALNDSSFQPTMSADPFALEMLSEAIAHLGVLSLRMAGEIAKAHNHERLSVDDLIEALKQIQKRVIESGKTKSAILENKIASSNEIKKEVLGIYFSDVTEFSGIKFNHRSSNWLSRFIRSYSVDSTEGIIRTAIPPAFGGAGIAAEDLNDDGNTDLLILSGLGNSLYINNGNGTFENFTEESGIIWERKDDKLPGEPRQPVIADFDNDGMQDIFISFVNDKHHIYRNTGNAVFEDKSTTAGLGGDNTVGGPCTAFDFNHDGLLDIYIGYFGDYLNGIQPTLARKNKNGLPNILFRNLGNFHFEEVINSGSEDTGWAQSVGHADINGDHFQDLIVGNDFGTNTYLLNLGNGKFNDVTREIGTDKPSFTMNIGISDLNKDHLPDFYISNIVIMEKDEKYVRPKAGNPMKFNPEVMANMRVVEANDLFLSSKTNNDSVKYNISKSITRGYSATGWSWDADFFDFDNDGDQDLYCLTGMNDFLVYSVENPYYQDPEGLDRKVLFAESNREPNVFFENNNGLLNAVEKKSGLDVVYNSRSAAFLDMDMDGDEDVVINNYHDEAIVFENNAETTENNWIKIKLEGKPKSGISRDAIGAKIITTANELDVWTEIHSTTGYLSCHPKEQHIGIGKSNKVNIKVIWPNSIEQEFKRVDACNRYTLRYGEELKLR